MTTKPTKRLTLDNGAGVVNFYTGGWVIDGHDAGYVGDVFTQFKAVGDDLFDKMKTAKDAGGDDAAWAVYHDQKIKA